MSSMKQAQEENGESVRVIVALGSNLAPREHYLAEARQALNALPNTRMTAESRILETEPVDVPAQFAELKFLNQVVVLQTTLDVYDFSQRMHAIEDLLGRVRTVRNGPRTIDLDLIDFGGLRLDDPELTLPHPRAAERDFVRIPLSELSQDNISDTLRQHAVSESTLQSVRDVLETCQFARYAPSTDSAAMDELYRKTSQTIDSLESEIKK